MSPISTIGAVFSLGTSMLLIITWANRRAYHHGTGIKTAVTLSALAIMLFVVLKHAP